MSFSGDLMAGLAALLHAAGHGVWSPDAPPMPGVGTALGLPLITLVRLPQTPERIICLTDYRSDDHGALSDAVLRVQVRIRGDRDPNTARTIADGIMNTLHGRTHFTVTNGASTVHVVQCLSRSESPLGPDGQDRHERVINFDLQVNRAGAHVETGA